MNILFAASEVAPFAKTGGLADVAGSLPQALAALGNVVRVVLPRYRCIDPAVYNLRHTATFYVPFGSWKERCDVLEGNFGDMTVWFVDKNIYYNRPGLYHDGGKDYHDNAERFVFFSSALPEICRILGFKPHIIHCNDWQTGLAPLYLKKFYHNDFILQKTRTVFTIHNLGYQGIFPATDFRLTRLGPEDFTPDGVEFYGSMNFLKAGILFSDIVTTVSKTYSREIQTPEYGHGLDGVLRRRSRDLIGIINGIDYDKWNPAKDAFIAKAYSADRLGGKKLCRTALLAETGLSDTTGPVIGMVTRLTAQKGLDILLDAISELMSMNIRLVILGSGDEEYHRRLEDASRTFRDRMRVFLKYDDGLARRIYAGADMFLMPSRYEPCGLGQMYALRYGAVPVVRRTGGLADTVINVNPRSGAGTGFLFKEYAGHALVESIRRAVHAFQNKKLWQRIMRAGMKVDFSWKHSAKEYVKVYRKITGK